MLDAIDVVNVLVRIQLTPQQLLHDKPVFQDPLPPSALIDSNVSLGIYIAIPLHFDGDVSVAVDIATIVDTRSYVRPATGPRAVAVVLRRLGLLACGRTANELRVAVLTLVRSVLTDG